MANALWTPGDDRIANARITCFMSGIEERCAVAFDNDYFQLQDWSLANPEVFWSAIWEFGSVVASKEASAVLEDADRFPGARWFPGARLNFAENLLRYRDERTALVSLLENGARRATSYAGLYRKVAGLAARLREQGIAAGDRVVGFMPNIEETVVAMLDRFGQIQPRILICADGYFYNGKTCDSLSRVADIARRIESIETVIVVPLVDTDPDISRIRGAVLLDDYVDHTATEIHFAQLPFDHPLFVMYSSGTTGVPKCIIHGAGGTLLQHLKEHQLLVDLTRDDVFFYFTTCGWMMWNWLVSGLATGATLVLYDGSPFARDGRLLLDTIDTEQISVFGTSAKFIAALQKAGHSPRHSHKLTSVRTILSTGSPLSHESFNYIYREFKSDVCLSSISGGTDILSCFVGGCPILPVYVGEIQAPGLGMAVEIWNEDGIAVLQEKGELVCTAPFPCCPLGFWNDTSGEKFHAAYFDHWPNVWAHGDYGEITAHGGFIIHGRSDAVLNPGGVRIGTAEIYRQVERIEAVTDSVVVGQDWEDDVRLVLFVVLRDGMTIDDALRAQICQAIRDNTTPRHVPAKILQVADIPRTISGKIVELAVRNVIHGRPVKNTDALANPEALALFSDLPELN